MIGESWDTVESITRKRTLCVWCDAESVRYVICQRCRTRVSAKIYAAMVDGGMDRGKVAEIMHVGRNRVNQKVAQGRAWKDCHAHSEIWAE